MLRRRGRVSGSLILAIMVSGSAGLCGAAGDNRPADAAAAVNPIEALQRDAENGNVKAQYVLGCCYNGDHGFARDPAKAAKWWRIAADRGLADAQFCLGLSCFLGEGVAKDVAEAAKWWRRAADQDQMDAQYFLGLSYHTGLGVPKSRELAVYWLKRSAGHGSKPAMDLLKEIGA
jgi:hypothetical protein